MSLDALSSVAYGPEAIVLGLVAAGAAAVSWTVPISVAIAVLLLVLVVSYRQVIAVHPDGGGATRWRRRIWAGGPACWPRRAWWSTTC